MAPTMPADIADSDSTSLPWVRASALRCFWALVTEMGGSPKAMLDDFGIAPQTLESGQSIVLPRSMVRLLEQAAEQLGCPDLGLRLAERQRAAPLFGAIQMVMRNSATLAGAFDFVVQHTGFYAPRAQLTLADEIGVETVDYRRGAGAAAAFGPALRVRLETRLWRVYGTGPLPRPTSQSGYAVGGRVGSGPVPPRNLHFREFPNRLRA
ncbi:AraC family transcriptional regulator ligand-binding domain-containing protein [uncultured Sphingomonas sp.]|uniref:AraC family transcriptional regulator ligand-binding domain-containing protein n=1 Tax=uncultured Sphingomonas sp. TaxID=158754 RepID=UPI0035CBC5CD